MNDITSHLKSYGETIVFAVLLSISMWLFIPSHPIAVIGFAAGWVIGGSLYKSARDHINRRFRMF